MVRGNSQLWERPDMVQVIVDCKNSEPPMQRIWFVIGGIAVLAISFFGTLFVLNSTDNRPRDSLRAEHAKSLKTALEKYRSARGKYPAPFNDNVIFDLKPELVDGGFLPIMPQDPFWNTPPNQYRYVSGDGKGYGLLFHLELASGKIPAGGACLTGVGTAGTGWWGQPPDCPF
jgi:hypothetical protein